MKPPRCQQLIISETGEDVRFCKRPATFEVVAVAGQFYPERVYEYLCSQHAHRVTHIGVAPLVRVRPLSPKSRLV
jgi:hypothetical protein